MSAKDRHYWTQLRAALSAGQWFSSSPAKAWNGSPLPWPELFRKFNKHCKGYADVAEVASQTHALALFLSANSKDEDQDKPMKPEEYPLGLGDECILPPERVEEAQTGYDVLKKLESSNFDTLNFALAYYAYALGNPSECLEHLNKVPDVSHVQNHIPLPTTLRASTLHVPTADGRSNVSTSASSETDSTVSIAEIKDGRAWAMTETIRSLCLQGMAHEKLYPSEPLKALKSYAAAFPLLTIVETELASAYAPLPTSSGKIDFSAFARFREIWRWVERLLWRAIVLGSKKFNVHHDHKQGSCRQPDSLWTWLQHYSSCSVYWPSNFRTSHRSTISVIYLRALVLRHGSNAQELASVPSNRTQPYPSWMQTARNVIQEYRAILNVSTKFPKAGERNYKVEDFAEQCVAVWETSGAVGEYAGWVLDVLWWATRLTFNSYIIQRHMTRLLYVSGDVPLARRTLRLYVQIVSKAHQAASASGLTGVELEHEADTDRAWVQTCVFGARMICRILSNFSSAENISVSTGPAKEIIDDLREAGGLIEKAKSRLDMSDKELAASVDLTEGIWLTVMAVKQHNPDTRPIDFSKAHTLFLRSIGTFPTPAAHYHLALSYARYIPHPLPPPPQNEQTSEEHRHEQDLERAILHAATAAEGTPSEIRYWHLLGLLSAKVEKWEAAEEALETGAAIGEATPSDEGEKNGFTHSADGSAASETHSQRRLNVPGNPSNGHVDGLPPSDAQRPMFQAPLPPKEGDVAPVYVLEAPSLPSPPSQSTETLPHSSILLSLFSDHPEPSRHEKFEYALQLRMTQVAVTEYVEGAEGAADKLPEVFQWIAEKRGVSAVASGRDQARTSAELSRSGHEGDMKLRTPSELALPISASNSQLGHEIKVTNEAANATSGTESSISGQPHIDSGSNAELQPPIPIMISPATPDGAGSPAPILSLPANESGGRANSLDSEKAKESDNASDTKRLRVQQAQAHDRDASKSKRMQQKLKSRVQKGSVRISTISKKIGHGVVRNGSLRRSNSTPDFHAVLRPMSYQASSIHSRRRLSRANSFDFSSSAADTSSPPPPPMLPPTTASSLNRNSRTIKENRLLSDLWLMSAATFRRLGKIEQAKGAIQEAEVRDEANPAVWVQLGLYYVALGRSVAAIEAFQKALFISPDDVSASVHFSRMYLFPKDASQTATQRSSYHNNRNQKEDLANRDNIDLVAGLLAHLTRGAGWDVAEVWYFLAKAYAMQGRKEREKECLTMALRLSENRGVRDFGVALGLCL